MKTVPLHGKKAAGRVALVDDRDYDLVMQYRWNVWECVRSWGTINGPYAVSYSGSGSESAVLRMHKLITGFARTDHINHDGLDNRRSNLRPATASQNLQNARPKRGCSSAYKGVFWHKKRRRWVAVIYITGGRRELGGFTTEAAAARAYDAAAREVFGEYAYLNFQDEPPPTTGTLIA